MVSRFCRLVLILILQAAAFVLPVPLEAQSSGFPSLEPDPRAAEYAGRAGLSWQDLTEISLWASGADPMAAAGRGKPSYTELVAAGVEASRGARSSRRPEGTGRIHTLVHA
jgi:hypothetical protein